MELTSRENFKATSPKEMVHGISQMETISKATMTKLSFLSKAINSVPSLSGLNSDLYDSLTFDMNVFLLNLIIFHVRYFQIKSLSE